MTSIQKFLKRGVDIVCSVAGLLGAGWIVLLAVAVAAVETRSSGVFSQIRVGRDGRLFSVYKVKTMRSSSGGTTVTTASDARITRSGAIFRRLKIDELPQLVNVLVGDMSLVGPRPDVPGFADALEGDERIVLSVRPGITGPATLYFRDEENILERQSDPERFNREVVFPMKVRLNQRYIENYRLVEDFRIIWATIAGLHYEDLYGAVELESR